MSNEPDVRLRSQLVSFGAFSHIRLRVLVVKMVVAVGANIHGGGAAEEAAYDRTQTVTFRRLTLMLFRHRS
ncbi:hypothetical protein F2Q68_00016139 [Brassica cretica]|uniref:Uncharacterized protein n=1 Tax=Brassica cretica TaxID=69181 RepID=A0A8S9HDG6_BRACR|nr:hypothetical protein F2Q68_00016139 [Brassica cretica]